MTEFDKYALEYDKMHAENVKPSGYEPAFFDEYKVKEIHRVLTSEGLADKPLSILNFGCGIGKSEPFLVQYFRQAEILGCDVSIESVKLARRSNPGLERTRFEFFDEGKPLPFAEKFDMIFIANVFHHIPHKHHEDILRDLRGHLAPGGSVFMFEHNPLNPLTVRTINRCPFDVDAVLLRPAYAVSIFRKAGFSRIERQFTLFFPHFLGALRPLEPSLGWLPLGAQYYVRGR